MRPEGSPDWRRETLGIKNIEPLPYYYLVATYW